MPSPKDVALIAPTPVKPKPDSLVTTRPVTTPAALPAFSQPTLPGSEVEYQDIKPVVTPPPKVVYRTYRVVKMSDSPPPKPDVKGEAEHINIKVTDANTEIFFKVKRTTPLRKMIDAFCKRTGKDPKALRFLYDGDRISEQDTPESLDLNDGDIIEAVNQQVGGQ